MLELYKLIRDENIWLSHVKNFINNGEQFMSLELSILFCKDHCLDNGHGLVQLLSGNSDFLVLSISVHL